jgi:hypothetical protein
LKHNIANDQPVATVAPIYSLHELDELFVADAAVAILREKNASLG